MVYGVIYPVNQKEEPLKIECQHFLDCIQHGTQPLSCGTSGLELVKILEAASESLRQNGAAVRLSEISGGGSGKASPACDSSRRKAAKLPGSPRTATNARRLPADAPRLPVV